MVIRDHFNSRIGFILATAGSAVGLGNIWGFPFSVGNGGGAAFVVMYLIFCFILCYPIMVVEFAIGRKTQKDAVGAFVALGYGKWKFIGIMGVFAGVFILSFYNVIAAWAFGYFLEIVRGNFSIGDSFAAFTADWKRVGSLSFIFMGLTAFIVARGVSAGIEVATKILMPTLFLIIVGLVIYAFTLPNAMQGIEFYLVPDFSNVTISTVYSALGQAFFSLSLGMGALITYGSYVQKNQNLARSGVAIVLVDVGIAFTAGLMIFPFVFYQGLPPNGGMGLIFATLPGVFSTLGSIIGIVIGAVFFLTLSFAALTSTVSLLEVPVAYVIDELKIDRTRAAWGTALLVFIVGIPTMLSQGAVPELSQFIALGGSQVKISFMALVVNFANNTLLPLGGFFIAVFAVYVWRKENLNAELTVGDPDFSGSLSQKYISFCLRYVCPVLLGLVLIVTISQTYFGLNLLEKIEALFA